MFSKDLLQKVKMVDLFFFLEKIFSQGLVPKIKERLSDSPLFSKN
jgi:uncharacterized membrane protein YGL010W